MAKATKTTRTLKRTVKTKVPAVLLELSEGEADLLQAVLARIGGDQNNSPRKYAVNIAKALKFATGDDYSETDAFKLMGTGAIGFKNYPEPDNGVNVEAAMNYMRQYRDRDMLKRSSHPTYVAYDEDDVYDTMGYR